MMRYRAKLVAQVRKHASRLLKLADAVEREGKERAASRTAALTARTTTYNEEE